MPTPHISMTHPVEWFRKIERDVALIRERLNNVLANTGLSVPGPGVVECDGTFNVVGTENVSGNLNVTGNTTIGGTTTISGLTTVSGTNGVESSNYVAGTSGWKFDGSNLEANTGVIGNGALANPVIPGVVNQTATNFSLGSSTYAEVVGQDVIVPAGCTTLQASVSLWVQVYNSKTAGGNNGTGGDYIHAEAHVGNLYGGHTATGVSGSGGASTASSGYAQVLSGLTPGGTVRIAGYSVSDYGIAADPSNKALLTATLTWLR